MNNIIFTLAHGALLLMFGVYLSAAFAGIQFNIKNLINFFGLYLACAILQGGIVYFSSPDMVRLLYPLITHIPIILFLFLVYRRKLTTSVISVCTSYLFCQPANWFGMLAYAFTQNPIVEMIVRMVMIVLTGFLIIKFVAHYIAAIFDKGTMRVLIFGSVPATYYLFDYATGVYVDLWRSHTHLVSEFLPFSLCIIYIVFCIVYHNVYEQIADAERNEHFLRIATEHQQKEIEQVKVAKAELKLMRHDMRLLLNNLKVCIDNGDTDRAQELLTSYSELVDETKLEYYCAIDSVNYILSAYTPKFEKQHINFIYKIDIPELTVDETLFSSILSNALDNAVNAQNHVPKNQRSIRLMLTSLDGRLLLSVKNPVGQNVIFSDGLPVSDKKGHGYGTRSIRYLTARLGGNSQFSVSDGIFNVRVII